MAQLTGAGATRPQLPNDSATERKRRKDASHAAALVATLVFLGALTLMVFEGVSAQSNAPEVSTNNITSRTKACANCREFVKRTASKTKTWAGADRSLIGEAFAAGAAPIIFQALLAGLVAFAAGAMVQRIWLGEYGISIGPIVVPALPVISEQAAATAVDLITESPDFAEILSPGPREIQPFPQFQSIDDDRLSLLSIRIELEEKLRKLASAFGLDSDITLSKLPNRLAAASAFDYKAAQGLTKLIEIGDRIAQGASIEPEAEARIKDSALNVFYALDELRSRALQTRSQQ